MRTVAVLAALAVTAGTAVGNAAAPPALAIRPPVVEPGGVAVVVVDRPGLAPTRVTATFDHARLAFFAGADGRPRALLGVDLATPPGAHEVVVVVRPAAADARAEHPRRDGGSAGSARVAATLTVRARTFPREELTVDRRYVEPDARALARIRREQARMQALLAVSSPARLWRAGFVLPAEGPLGSSFGLRRFFNGQERSPHAGQDFRVAEGTPVIAAEAGRVVLASPLYFSGNTVVVDHGLGLFTLYFHLATFRVREGAFVERGAVVGTSGRTGRVTGPHLHWAARVGGARVDPLALTRLAVLEDDQR